MAVRRRLPPGAKQRSRELRGRRTDAEGLLWWKLRALNRRGFHFRRQVPFKGYTLDFAEHSGSVVIELDGDQHGQTTQRRHDAVRDGVIAREHYLVLRFWNYEIFGNLDGVAEQIVREVVARRPPPEIREERISTSPQGGGD
jgi:very-short-patch-repair endonuclease